MKKQVMWVVEAIGSGANLMLNKWHWTRADARSAQKVLKKIGIKSRIVKFVREAV